MPPTPRRPRNAVPYDIPAALAHLSAEDPKLAALIQQVGPFTLKLKHQHSPFEALLEAIIYQQLHGKAAAAILRRLIEAFGDLHPQPEQLITIPDHILRGAGLSGAKALALRDLAAKTIDGTVPTLAKIRRMSDDEIVERLTAVRGIGPWTVEMLLMFRLGRPDIFPTSDYGVRKGFLLTFGPKPKGSAKGRPITPAMLPKPAAMLRRAKKWRPYRSVASWYLWRACDLAGKPSPPPE